MASHRMNDEQMWKTAFEQDPELRACVRKAASVVMEELDLDRMQKAKNLADHVVAYLHEKQARLAALVHEIGCMEEILKRIFAFPGEGQLLKANLDARLAALLQEKKEIEARLKPEDLPMRAEYCLNAYEEMRAERDNAEFFLQIIDGGEDAESGIHRVADEPRGAGDHGATPDAVRDV